MDDLLLDFEHSNINPIDHIQSKDFIEGVLKTGSLISMLENKKINTTVLFSLLLERADYQKFFTEATSSNSFREALSSLLYLNPSLVKSKITKSVVRKLNGKTRANNGLRKASIQ